MRYSPLTVALAACAAAFPVSIAAGNIALAALAAALGARALAERRRILDAWRAEPAILALLAYAAAGLVCAAASATPKESLLAAAKDLHRPLSLLLFVGAIALEPAAPVLPAFGLSFGALAVWGLCQTAAGLWSPEAGTGLLPRAHGFTHPVVYGEMMALAALGGLCLLLRPGERDVRGRGQAAAFTALAVAALLASQTRMALFAAAAGFAVVAALEPRARRWSLPALGIVAVAIVGWELGATGGRPLSHMLRYDPADPQQARWGLWLSAWRIFRDRPWLGTGPGGFRAVFPSYHPGALDNETGWGSAHNLYLHQAAERGLLGAAALAAALGTLLLRALSAARRRTDARSLWAVSATTALLVMSVTETTLHNEQFSTILLLVWAWGVAPPRR